MASDRKRGAPAFGRAARGGDCQAASMTSSDKHLPEANEFSPGIISLKKVLELVAAAKGDRSGLVESIRLKYFTGSALKQKDSKKRLKIQQTRASNVLIGLKGYGLIESLERPLLTSVGK